MTWIKKSSSIEKRNCNFGLIRVAFNYPEMSPWLSLAPSKGKGRILSRVLFCRQQERDLELLNGEGSEK